MEVEEEDNDNGKQFANDGIINKQIVVKIKR